MAEIVNLREARKARDRAGAKVAAAANRAAHGRTKGETTAARAERDAIDRTLDGAKREPVAVAEGGPGGQAVAPFSGPKGTDSGA